MTMPHPRAAMKTVGARASSAVGGPFQWVAALRNGRVFHPDGVLTTGSVERTAPPGDGLPVETTHDVVARLSKGLGLPGAVPDIIGLAVRLPPQPSAATPWDILLASAGTGPAGRVVGVRPALRWSGQPLSSVMPVRYHNRNWWISARMVDDINGFGVPLADVRDRLRDSGVRFDIDQACGAQPFRPLARLTLRGVVPSDAAHDVAFDPVLHVAPGVRPAPQWLASLRAHAYDRSRRGRHAG